jgi:predicted aspartyl protease
VKHKFDSTKQLIVVRAKIVGPTEDTMVQLALDTGASSTVIGWKPLKVVGYLDADVSSHVEMTTSSGTTTVPKITLRKIESIGKHRRGLEVIAHSLPIGASVDGLLGLDFFRKSRLMIDFRKNVLRLD